MRPQSGLQGEGALPTEPQIAALLLQHHLEFITDTGLSREFMAYTAGRARELRNCAAARSSEGTQSHAA